VPKPRGDSAQAFGNAAVQLDVEYRVPAEHHNPMELFGTTVVRDERGTLAVYDKTQGVQNVQRYLCNVFGYSEDDIRVLAPFVGGAFGAGLRPQYQVLLAVLAAHALKRSVRVSLTRQQMFSLAHRPITWQRVALAATPDGKLESIVHEAVSETSRFEDYSEMLLHWSGLLYQCDNVTLDHKVAPLDVNTPGAVRAPGQPGACTRSNARWTSSPSGSAPIQSSSDSRTTPRRIRTTGCYFPARPCAIVTDRGRSALAGSDGPPNRGRCKRATLSSVGAWQAASGMPFKGRRPPTAC
jgi:hypothetical protein